MRTARVLWTLVSLLLAFLSRISFGESSSSSLLLLCTTDGSIYALNAWTGRFQSTVVSGPPLLSKHAASESSSAVVPGLDGKLYWQQEPNQQLQALPLTISSLLHHPVRSCDEDERHCGIITATAHTQLLAVDAHTGNLLWKTTSNEDSSTTSSQHPAVLLQRKDYWVQQVSTATGKQVWNITLGTYQALEFENEDLEVDDDSDDDPLVDDVLPDYRLQDKKETIAAITTDPPLPSIVFSNTGLAAVHPETHEIVWQMDTPSVLASVFGIYQGQWKTVTVLQESDILSTDIPPSRQLAASSTSDSVDYAQLWAQHEAFYQQQQQSQKQRLLLPSHPPPEHVCLAGDCLGPSPLLLRLPAPSAVQADGLLLSWSFVAFLVAVLVALVVGARLWYISKTKKWNQQQHVKFETRQYVSLPGNWKRNTTVPTLTHSDPGEAAMSTETSLNGIPLVRYSRYASEFHELHALGKGGFGTVFCCRNVLDGRDYAMKKVSIREKKDDSFQQRLQRVLREVKILAVLDHPNIVRYYTAWLELEQDAAKDAEVEDTTTLSRCYSSSLLTETKSQWPMANARRPSFSSNPLGWKNGISEEPSFSPRRNFTRVHSSEDFGFIFERSEDEQVSTEDRGHGVSEMAGKEESYRKISESLENADESSTSSRRNVDGAAKESKTVKREEEGQRQRHTLYIQMQLCSQKTLGDFLQDAELRKGPADTGVDIPTALRLFLQIAQAVQHVHEQGLIHRDLKPSNCFMDESSGTIKVGDFGLSRESSDKIEESPALPISSGDEDHTAGVGTRSYASPEQMKGSDYDSSTDVYSLGIILFELCYPMYTGMERNICLSQLRTAHFPEMWQDAVGKGFPTLQDLIQSMLQPKPSDRPTAGAVAQHIQNILGEFTILSLDKHVPDMLLLRVQAEQRQDALQHTIQLLHEAAHPATIDIVQYGLRSSHSKEDEKPAAIMEFAIRSSVQGSVLVSKLEERPEVMVARQVSHSSSL